MARHTRAANVNTLGPSALGRQPGLRWCCVIAVAHPRGGGLRDARLQERRTCSPTPSRARLNLRWLVALGPPSHHSLSQGSPTEIHGAQWERRSSSVVSSWVRAAGPTGGKATQKSCRDQGWEVRVQGGRRHSQLWCPHLPNSLPSSTSWTWECAGGSLPGLGYTHWTRSSLKGRETRWA